jgi:3-oxoacyl-[acyl-carrier-protein] synthase II
MSKARVQISGYGFITPIGSNLKAFEHSLKAQTSAVQIRNVQIKGHDSFDVPVAPCSFDEKLISSPSKLPMDRATAMALYSLDQAIDNATINLKDYESDRIGVFWGSGMAGASSFDQTTNLIYEMHSRIRPTSVVTGMPSAPASELSIKTRAQGSCITYACACASSSIAIGEGMRAIRGGWLDLAIVGGSESMLTPGILMAWNALRVLAPVKNGEIGNIAPFSKSRSGFAMGEGAAVFLLERENNKTHKKYFLSGYATNSDGLHMTNPQSQTQIRVMQASIKDAELSSGDIGYVNAHGTGTLVGDATEAKSIGSVFGPQNILVSSTKSMHGHLLGASGAVELISCIIALESEELPLNSENAEKDIDIDLNLVTKTNQKMSRIKHVMSNSFAFGGTNACLIVSKS